jgi:hypothetical protein
LKLQVFLILLLLTMAIQGWAACTVDENKILQFNPHVTLISDASGKDLHQFMLLDNTVGQSPDQTSADILLKSGIEQDLKAILQIPANTDDISFVFGDLKQGEWRQNLLSDFSQILDMQVESNVLGELPSEFSINQGIANDINSNIMILTNNGVSWDSSMGMDLNPQGIVSSENGDVNVINPMST